MATQRKGRTCPLRHCLPPHSSLTARFRPPHATTAARPRIVIAGAGRAAQALVRQLTRTPFAGAITVLSNRDDAPEELLELAVLPQVSVRFGQPASYIDAKTAA